MRMGRATSTPRSWRLVTASNPVAAAPNAEATNTSNGILRAMMLGAVLLPRTSIEVP